MLQWFGAFHSRISWFSVFVIGGNAQGRSKAVWFPPKHPSNWMHYIKKRFCKKIHSQQLLRKLLNGSFLFTRLTSEMGFTRNTIFCLAALLFCSECVLSRPVEKRQTTQELDHEPLQQENDDMLKFALLSRSSGKYMTMLKNGSVFASGLPVQGILDSKFSVVPPHDKRRVQIRERTEP